MRTVPFPPICSKTQKLKPPKRSCAPASTAAFAMPPAPPTCSPATNSKAARPHLPHQKRSRRGHPPEPTDGRAHRQLPRLPRLRDHLPERRGLFAPLGDGPTAARSARQAAIDGPPAARPADADAALPRPHALGAQNVWVGRAFSFLMPRVMRPLLAMAPKRLPRPAAVARPGVVPAEGTRRLRVALLTGCVQQVLGPQINDATVRLLTRLGAEVVIPPDMGCCGALTFHMGERKRSLKLMQHTIEVWHRELEAGLDAIVLNTSGCGTAIKEYDHIFRHDPQWADKAKAVVKRVQDVSEVVAQLGLGKADCAPALKVAYHDACSLQHGQHVTEPPRQLLQAAGFEVVEVPEGHICCGSAGTYNMLRPDLAQQLQARKVEHIASVAPQIVAAGNIGCMEQIAARAEVPVVHTVELLDWATGGPAPTGVPSEAAER